MRSKITLIVTIIAGILVAILGSTLAITYNQMLAEYYNDLGIHELEKGSYTEAIKYFTKAIS